MKRFVLPWGKAMGLFALLILFAGRARTADSADSLVADKVIARMLDKFGREDLFNDLKEPLLTHILESVDGKELTLPGFFQDLHITPKFFHAEGEDTDGVLGFEFNFKKSAANRVMREKTDSPMGVSWTLEAKGNVAADAKKNPNNLLESGTSLHLFQGIGGVTPRSTTPEETKKKLDEAISLAATDPEFLKQRGPRYAALANEVTQQLKPQFFWDLQAHATLESDQQFHKKQWAYGGKLSLVGRDWKNNSALGRANVFDYPFAATRWLFNKEDFMPSGRTLPSLVIGLDQVDPSKDEERFKLDSSKDKFTRWRAEAAFKTRVLTWEQQKLFVRATYRYFKEASPSAAIEKAGRDEFKYFVVKVDLPAKFFATYTRGKLPFDRKSGEVYALGWALHE